ncbi:MAG: hypothetical protein LBR67_03815 [Dysgonamonadaceae bacterium]|jgi:hypothetical protein|nr:hypothetical protein [Dysgonamonadaceae bacterium]
MKRPDLKITLGVLISACLMFACGDDDTSPPESGTVPDINVEVLYNNVTQYQTNYIRSLQIPSGAIKDTESNTSKITPYFANFACLALLKNPTTENIAAAQKYISWYIGKLNGTTNPHKGGVEIAGSVYDYFGETETTNGTYDSVDSYAAVFLMLVREFASLSAENKAWLQQYSDKIALIANAMERCIDTDYNTLPGEDNNDGLSVASHVYAIKYLMDNCEVNLGLKAAKWLKENGLLTGDSGDFAALIEKNTTAIESGLWKGSSYCWYSDGRTSVTSNWSVFYPDAAAQLYPSIFEVINSYDSKANKLYTQFNHYYSKWSEGQVYSGNYPWTIIVYAAANINDATRVNEYMAHINSYNIKNQQKAYWYSMEAACTVLAVDKIKNTTAPEYVPVN